jgi:hypothetical protein
VATPPLTGRLARPAGTHYCTPFRLRPRQHCGKDLGLFSKERQEEVAHHSFTPEVHFLVTPDPGVGIRVGWGLNDQSSRFFRNGGLGWRF